jgi:hypothetical protein
MSLTTNEAIKKLRENDLGELSDLIGQYETETSFEKTTGDLDDDLRALIQKPVGKLTSDDLEALTGFSAEEQLLFAKSENSSALLP